MATKNSKALEAKDVFISYRRKDGATAARLLYDALDRRQISVFFDRESIESGNFDDALRRNLEAARNIIIVVSQEMFSRGMMADGAFDMASVESDWVYKEIQISLEAGKNIIPIFVNGVDGFPQNLPSQIAEVARKDALKFNHEHFDAEMNKLISRLITPRHRLLAAYLEVDKEVYVEPLDSLFHVSKNLSKDGGKEIEIALTKIIRSNWEQTSLTDEQALDVLFEGGSPSSIKSICRKLKLDDTGGLRRIKSNVLSWLKNEPSREYKKSASDNDRVIDVISAFAELFKSTEDRQRVIEQIEITFDGLVKIDSKRSSFDVFWSVFQDGIDIEDFFKIMEQNFQEKDIKFVSEMLMDDSRGRKKELIDRIVDFVNYDYNTSDPA